MPPTKRMPMPAEIASLAPMRNFILICPYFPGVRLSGAPGKQGLNFRGAALGLSNDADGDPPHMKTKKARGRRVGRHPRGFRMYGLRDCSLTPPAPSRGICRLQA